MAATLPTYTVQVHTLFDAPAVVSSGLSWHDAHTLAISTRYTRANNGATDNATTVIHMDGYGRVWGIEDNGDVHVY